MSMLVRFVCSKVTPSASGGLVVARSLARPGVLDLSRLELAEHGLRIDFEHARGERLVSLGQLERLLEHTLLHLGERRPHAYLEDALGRRARDRTRLRRTGA